MKTGNAHFSEIVESVYDLPLEDKLELKNLLEHNISEARREEILASYQAGQQEHKEGKLKFSSDADELMNLL